jgi:hypothetical protein
MKSSNKQLTRTIGLFLYLTGVLLGFVLLALSVWGDIEASTFGVRIRSDERLSTLKCPVFITKDEVGMISAVIENPTDRDVTPLVRSTITFGFVTLVDEIDQKIEIPAGGSKEVAWKVSEANAAYRRLILTHIYQLSNYSVPSRQGSCGIVVLPFVGPTGQQVFNASFVISMVLVAVGIALYSPKNILRIDSMNGQKKRSRTVVRSYLFLGAYLLIATLLSLVGIWLLSIFLMLFAIVSVIAVFSYAVSSN